MLDWSIGRTCQKELHVFVRLWLPSGAQVERRTLVQTLRKIAASAGVSRVADNASKDKVQAMAEAILASSVDPQDKAVAEQAWTSYKDTFPAGSWPSLAVAAPAATDVPSAAASSPQAPVEREWKFQAAQLTYNCKNGDWASADRTVLHDLLMRLVVFIQGVLALFEPQGDTRGAAHCCKSWN